MQDRIKLAASLSGKQTRNPPPAPTENNDDTIMLKATPQLNAIESKAIYPLHIIKKKIILIMIML